MNKDKFHLLPNNECICPLAQKLFFMRFHHLTEQSEVARANS